MSSPDDSVAFGAPGIEPRWTSSAKEGVGTSYHTGCRRVVYSQSRYRQRDFITRTSIRPNTRDFQFLISDGETFCHEEKRDLDHVIEYPERDCVFLSTHQFRAQRRYRSVKHVLTDPHRSVLLVHTKARGVR